MATVVAFHAHPDDEVLLTGGHADLLLSYDPRGGYGHRDHIRVHEAGASAAAQCGTRVWEATLPAKAQSWITT